MSSDWIDDIFNEVETYEEKEHFEEDDPIKTGNRLLSQSELVTRAWRYWMPELKRPVGKLIINQLIRETNENNYTKD